MTDRYAVVPAHLVRNADNFHDSADAAVAASLLVGKDRVARIVVKLLTEVTLSAKPHVHRVQIAEVARG